MKIYRYWRIEKATLRIGQEEHEITCYGGSNISESDAAAKAREKIEKVKRKIEGDYHAFDTYDAEIREEIVRVISDKAIITRNRYGAQVLNVQDMMILDIDRPKYTFWDLFRGRNESQNKPRIVGMVRKLAQRPDYRSCGFRLYETQKGMRVIVVGRGFDPKARETRVMMRTFNSDRLYRFLCRKQDCFRARLTPKPNRIGMRGYKVKFPREPGEEQEFQAWLADYEAASRDFSACRFIDQLGTSISVPDLVRVHDEISGAHRNLRLA